MDFLIWIIIAAGGAAIWAWSRRPTPKIRIPERQTRSEPPRTSPVRPQANAPLVSAPVASVSFSVRSYDSSEPVNHIPDYAIEYADADGVVTERQVEILSRGWKDESFRAWCFLRAEERSFRYDRVMGARNLRTGRSIKNLREYIRRNW